MREPARGAAEPEGPHLHVVLSQTALFFVLGADAYWLPTLLNRRFGMSVGEAGTLAGGVIVVGGLVGTLLGGWVADWRRKRSPRADLEVPIVGFVAAALATRALGSIRADMANNDRDWATRGAAHAVHEQTLKSGQTIG